MNTPLLLALALTVQEPSTVPPGTFQDPNTRALVERAVEARQEKLSDIESYEADLRETVYVGVDAERFRRERGLFQEEHLARIHWRRSGEHAVFWTGLQKAIAGVEGNRSGDSQVSDSASTVPVGEPRMLRPDFEAFLFGETESTRNPLTPGSVPLYRYYPGDTLQIGLPDGRRVSLIEVRVEPKAAGEGLVVGSIWLEEESAALARSAIRPSEPIPMRIETSDGSRDVPGLIRPLETEIDYVLIDYAFFDFTWWLPRRFAFHGELRIGGFVSVPVQIEWSLSGYEVNPATPSFPVTGPLPDGWSREKRPRMRENGEEVLITFVAPPVEELLNSSNLSAELPGPAPDEFTRDEIDSFRAGLDRLVPKRPAHFRTSWGLEGGLTRYNRVEALSVGLRQQVPLGQRTEVDFVGRIGIGDLKPNVELSLVRGSARMGGFRRLEHTSDWENPFNLTSSLSNFVLGNDRGEYYRSTGADLEWMKDWQTVSGNVRLFYEDHDAVEKETDFHLQESLGGRPMPSLIRAEEGHIHGATATLRWQRGFSPDKVIGSGRLVGEFATGDFQYRRALASVALTYPLPFKLAGAFEVQAGSSWGTVPLQKRFFLGSTGTLRGFKSNSVIGESFWAARKEVASRFALARVAVFTDFAWAGPRADFPSFDDYRASVGIGLSTLDGLIRLDYAHIVRGGSGWDLILYLDGIF